MEEAEREATFRAALELFDRGRYLAAHELFEELWEDTQGESAEFYKGLIQASICLHHFESGNLPGASQLYSGHRRCLSGYVPRHAGIDVARFLGEMQEFLRPALDGAANAAFDPARRPRILGS